MGERREVKGEEELRQRRYRRLSRIFMVVVLLPTLVAVAYYGFIARAQYGSVMTLGLETGAAPMPTAKRGAASDPLARLEAMVRSRAAYDALKEHGFRTHFASTDVDFVSRLGSGEDRGYARYRDQIDIEATSEAAVDVTLFAFDPETAETLNRALLEHLRQRLEEERDATRQQLVAPAQLRAEEAQRAMTDAQGEVPRAVAQRRLTEAVREVELAKTEALRREARVVVVAAPSRPDLATRPRRLWNVLTVFFTAFALGGLVLLLGDVVREHGQF
ncbi:MAG: hypothetical protein AAF928_07490 [Myxococcota bacterium]